MYKTFLQWLISKFYKNKVLKLSYGLLFFKNILRDDFAKEHGVLEVLTYFKLIKPSISKEFVRRRFNTNSTRYESFVANGGYEKGELGSLVAEVSSMISKRQIVSCLELGCGSGLVAEKLSILNVNIIGVDISEEMISIARSKNLYKDLQCADIESYLNSEHCSETKLVFACSVIQFFDDQKFTRLLQSLTKVLSNDGIFIFTFDICGHRTLINENLYMEHSVDFITSEAKNYFQDVLIKQIPIGRLEQKRKIQCGLAILENPFSYQKRI